MIIMKEWTVKTLEKKIDNNEMFAILFTASWCGHCKTFKPTYDSATKSGIGISCGVMDAYENNKQLEKIKIGNRVLGGIDGIVKGYPTLLFFAGDGQVGMYKGTYEDDDLLKHVMLQFIQDYRASRGNDAKNTVKKAIETTNEAQREHNHVIIEGELCEKNSEEKAIVIRSEDPKRLNRQIKI